ncbi:MAG: manganese efflux pump [Mailhella sp.]|nr:manganese efflux pump [Mailhella sp.]
MELTLFIANSMLLGAGLAMDAFSVSVANGLGEPAMPAKRMAFIAGTFAFFQFAMPLLGWLCVHFVVETFKSVQIFIPYAALILLAFIGGKMILDALRCPTCSMEQGKLSLRMLLAQGIATSIDALSVGFAIAEYGLPMALAASLIIAAVTFALCMAGVRIGKLFGMRLAQKASIVGGIILICIGLEIFFGHF